MLEHLLAPFGTHTLASSFNASVCLLAMLLMLVVVAICLLLIASSREVARAKEIAFALRVQPRDPGITSPQQAAFEKRLREGHGLDEVIAEQVHRHVNNHYYLTLLKAVEAALKLEGFVLWPTRCASMNDLSTEAYERVVRALVTAKFNTLAPYIEPDDLHWVVERDLREGSAESWLKAMLDGLFSTGIFIAPFMPEVAGDNLFDTQLTGLQVKELFPEPVGQD